MHQENHIQKFTCGNATFKDISKIIKKIIEKSKKIQKVLKNNRWQIQNGDYQKYNWKKMFLHMSECSAQKLYLWVNNKIHIIQQIQYVQYSNLKQLYLNFNKINNIQSLNSIHFNCLQTFGLTGNEISQIKCLNKLSTPSLNFIDLNYNPLIEINALTRSKINSKLFECICLQEYGSNYDPINQDLSVFVKLNSESVESLWITPNTRINQVKVQSMLKLKFPSIDILKGQYFRIEII